jgi:hypothetical protein
MRNREDHINPQLLDYHLEELVGGKFQLIGIVSATSELSIN